jgi:hypothetical protein
MVFLLPSILGNENNKNQESFRLRKLV